MQVKVKKLSPLATLPTYATDGSGCFDLRCVNEPATVSYAIPQIFRTGLSFEIPKGFVMMIFSRSGHGFEHDVRLGNCVGIIDSDYRGEVMVKLASDGKNLKVNSGDRIAQALIIPIPKVEFTEAEELSVTSRGTGGFGSTGK